MLVRTRNVIDTAGADAVIAAAEAAAAGEGHRVYICVVDPAGEVVAMRRTPGAQVAIARLVPLRGGIPIRAGDEVAGAIGVSGASSAGEDEELAVLGARAVESALV